MDGPLNPKCKLCDDFAWVCEAHSDRPWEGHGPRACTCGGAGIPVRAAIPVAGWTIRRATRRGFSELLVTKPSTKTGIIQKAILRNDSAKASAPFGQ